MEGSPPFMRRLFRSICLLGLWVAVGTESSVFGQLTIMTMGDSITRGFPTEDFESYPKYLRDTLTTALTFVGDASGGAVPDDLGATEYMVSNNGSVINEINIVFNSTGTGVKERLEQAILDDVATPDYIVILIGINDLVELINPTDSDDWFVPGAVVGDFSASGGTLPPGNGDYRSGGIFIDGGVDRTLMEYGSSPSLLPVAPIKERYKDLLDVAVAAFPNTRVVLVTVPIPDAVGTGGDDQYENSSRRPLIKETVESYNLQIEELAATDDHFTCVNPNLIRPTNTTDTGSPPIDVPSPDLHDGVHPSVPGYQKIGKAVASEILYLEWTKTQFAMGATKVTWGHHADPDDDGWPNAIEYYLATDPNTSDVPNLMTTHSGNMFDFTYEMDEDLIVNSVAVEYSTDLNVWTADGLSARELGTPKNGVVPVTTTLTLANWERVFFRLIPTSHP